MLNMRIPIFLIEVLFSLPDSRFQFAVFLAWWPETFLFLYLAYDSDFLRRTNIGSW